MSYKYDQGYRPEDDPAWHVHAPMSGFLVFISVVLGFTGFFLLLLTGIYLSHQ